MAIREEAGMEMTGRKGMRIAELRIKDFKGIDLVAFALNENLIQITGRNGAGKTSVIDFLWFLLAGQAVQGGKNGRKALPGRRDSVIRNNAEEAQGRVRIRGEEVEFTVTRTIARGGSQPTLNINMVRGKMTTTPQRFLDDLLGALTFDPLAFVRMDSDEQIAELRKASKVDLDFAALEAADARDYEARTAINKEVKQLQGQLAGMTVLSPLPAKKLDEAAILKKLESAADLNRKAQATFQAKQELGAAAARIGAEAAAIRQRIDAGEGEIARLEKQIEAMRKEIKAAEAEETKAAARHKTAEAKFNAAPAGEPVDVSALTAELQSTQRTNRAIDVRDEYNQIETTIDEKRRKAQDLTDKMDGREKQRKDAMAKSKLKIDGLTFDQSNIWYNGVLLENLGEGEQIRIATLIGMAANPKLRTIFIRNGEALDDDGIKSLAKLAKDNDFQIIMTRVETSGKVGIFIEEGKVKAVNGQ